MDSRGYTIEKALEIMDSQMSEEEFRENTNALIDNTEDAENTHRQIDELIGNREPLYNKI